MKKLELVYDFKDQLPDMSFLMNFGFMAIGISVAWYAHKYKDSSATLFKGWKNRRLKIFGIVFASFAFLHGAITIPLELRDYFRAKDLYKKNQCSTVEGVVEHYHPMPVSGHDSERFDVNGIPFEYSDFEISNGYHNAASHGGAIKPGIFVRISYYTKDKTNFILKLETEY